jgi:hypothetical protein
LSQGDPDARRACARSPRPGGRARPGRGRRCEDPFQVGQIQRVIAEAATPSQCRRSPTHEHVVARAIMACWHGSEACRQTCARHSSRKQRLPEPGRAAARARRGGRASGERGPRRGDEAQWAKPSHRGLWRNFSGGYCNAEHVSLIATPDLMRFVLPASMKKIGSHLCSRIRPRRPGPGSVPGSGAGSGSTRARRSGSTPLATRRPSRLRRSAWRIRRAVLRWSRRHSLREGSALLTSARAWSRASTTSS